MRTANFSPVLAVGLLMGSPLLAQEPGYLIEADRLSCVIENADVYRTPDGSPAFIALPSCPEPTNPFLSSVQNAGPDVTMDTNAPDTFVALSPEQLDCLAAQKSLPEGATLIRFYPDSCRLEALQD